MPIKYFKKGTKEAITADVQALVADPKNAVEAAQLEAIKPVALAGIASLKSTGAQVQIDAQGAPQWRVSVNVLPLEILV